jgi:cell division protease FtsH
VAETVDKEIRRIIDEQYAKARAIIEENREKVERMARALLEWETLEADQIEDIMTGKEPRPPAGTSGTPKSDAGTPKKPSGKAVKPRLDSPAGEH